MAIDPSLTDKMLQEATERAAEKFGAPIKPAWIKGNVIHVRCARGHVTYQIHQSEGQRTDPASGSGPDDWWLEEILKPKAQLSAAFIDKMPRYTYVVVLLLGAIAYQIYTYKTAPLCIDLIAKDWAKEYSDHAENYFKLYSDSLGVPVTKREELNKAWEKHMIEVESKQQDESADPGILRKLQKATGCL